MRCLCIVPIYYFTNRRTMLISVGMVLGVIYRAMNAVRLITRIPVPSGMSAVNLCRPAQLKDSIVARMGHSRAEMEHPAALAR